MQQPCSFCLARRALGMKGIRSYGVVPKPPPKSRPAETNVQRAVKGRFGLSKPTSSHDGAHRRPPPNHGIPGKSSRGAINGSARRSRLSGFLDESTSTTVKLREDSPKTPHGTTTSDATTTRRFTRTYDRESGPSNSSSNSSTRRVIDPPRSTTTRQSTREPLYPPAQPTHDQEPSTSCRKYHFKALHHDTAIQAFHRPSTLSNPIIKYRDPYLFLRAAPTHTLPTPPPSPFPPNLPTLKSKHPNMGIINFGVVASKNAVSPFAPERGRVRKRFKNAVEEVLNGGKGEVRADWSYLAVLNREVYEADMRDLCGSLENGLKFIRRQQERGIGSDTGQGTRRR